MNSLQTNYQQLLPDDSEAPHESVIFHVASEGSKSRWNHVEDLDSFFRRLYFYHQNHGYTCIVVDEFLRLLTCIFIIFGILIYSTQCIYINFDDPASPLINQTTIHFGDLFIPPAKCAAEFGFFMWVFVALSTVFVAVRVYKLLFCTARIYKEIEQFYETAMKIPKNEIDNLTWHEVMCRLREVQHEQQMCVHKSDLTELDIYHRVLRNKNFMVAMINKNILPLRYNIKYIGDWVYLTSGLEYNIELLLFGSLLSPFKRTGALKEEYKKYSKRKDVADELSKAMLILGLVNLLLAPFIFVWQCLQILVSYIYRVRVEPGVFAVRRWSVYSKYYLRHFNELDHELNARLGRAYNPAKDYMMSFSSPLCVIVLRFAAYILGSFAMFLFIWSLYRDTLLIHVVNYFPILTGCSLSAFVIWKCLPDENSIYFPDELMKEIIAEIHYVPDDFKTKAHTSAVRDEFSHLFPFFYMSLFEDLISPLVIPYILIGPMRRRSLDIVDFFRNFTVDVAGVGDVCSFALMDVSKHGNQRWSSEAHTKADQYQQAENGKTELSLIHFKTMNPQWKPPPASEMFISNFREHVNDSRKCPETGLENPYFASINSLSSMGSKYASLMMESVHSSIHQEPQSSSYMRNVGHSGRRVVHGGVNRTEGPPYFHEGNFFSSLQSNERDSLHPVECTTADMSLSALYLHEVHQKQIEASTSSHEFRTQISHERESNVNEESPLLEIKMSS